jgi:hypothetical protein
MRSWPALLLAPLVVLGEQSIVYSMVTPSCARQDRTGLHLVAAVSLLAVLVMTAMAWRAWRRHVDASEHGEAAARSAPHVTRADGDTASQRPHFIALMALIVGALSVLVCLVLWVPIWFLSPCY